MVISIEVTLKEHGNKEAGKSKNKEREGKREGEERRREE